MEMKERRGDQKKENVSIYMSSVQYTSHNHFITLLCVKVVQFSSSKGVNGLQRMLGMLRLGLIALRAEVRR